MSVIPEGSSELRRIRIGGQGDPRGAAAAAIAAAARIDPPSRPGGFLVPPPTAGDPGTRGSAVDLPNPSEMMPESDGDGTDGAGGKNTTKAEGGVEYRRRSVIPGGSDDEEPSEDGEAFDDGVGVSGTPTQKSSRRVKRDSSSAVGEDGERGGVEGGKAEASSLGGTHIHDDLHRDDEDSAYWRRFMIVMSASMPSMQPSMPPPSDRPTSAVPSRPRTVPPVDAALASADQHSVGAA